MPGQQAKSDTPCVVLGFCRHRKLFYQLWYPYGYFVRVFLIIRGSRFHLRNRILRIARKMVDETKRGAMPREISRCKFVQNESAMGQRIFSCRRLIPLCRRFVGPGECPAVPSAPQGADGIFLLEEVEAYATQRREHLQAQGWPLGR